MGYWGLPREKAVCRGWGEPSVTVVYAVVCALVPWTAARQASLSITNSWSLLKLMSIAPSLCAWRPDFPGAAREAP